MNDLSKPEPGLTESAAIARKLRAFYGAMFAFAGIYMPFWPVWLAERGMTAEAIGTLLAVGAISRVIASPIAGHLVDRRQRSRGVIVVLCAAAFAAFALHAVAREFWSLMVVAILFSLFWSPIMPLGENLTLLVCYQKKLDYGRIRLWGSLAFVAASMVGGLLLRDQPAALILWLLLGAAALSLGAAVALPNLPAPAAASPGRHPGGSRHLLASPDFILFVAAAGLVQASHAMLYAFGTLHWRAYGHGGDVIGALWAEGVVAEILLFAAGPVVLRRFDPAQLMLLGAAAGMVRWLGTAAFSELPALVLLQALHGLSFGATHLGAMHYLARNVPPERSASAQSVYSVIVGAVASGGAMYASGPLYAALQGRGFVVMAAAALAGGAFCSALLWRSRVT